MKVLTALLSIVIAIAAPALRADEVQVILTGQAFCVPTPCGTAPFEISFDVNTLSGVQQYSLYPFNGVPSVAAFDAGPLQITNFTETIGGQTVFLASTTGGVDFMNGFVEGGVSDFAFGVANFNWDSGDPNSPFAAANFSLANYLLALNGLDYGANASGFSPGLANTTGSFEAIDEAHFVVRRVPEPGVLPLLLLGLGALGVLNRTRLMGRA